MEFFYSGTNRLNPEELEEEVNIMLSYWKKNDVVPRLQRLIEDREVGARKGTNGNKSG